MLTTFHGVKYMINRIFSTVKTGRILEVRNMSEMLMTNVKEKFANARELCAGMSEEIYALTDYISAVANDSLVPAGFLMMFACVMHDLEVKRCGFARAVEFPEYLIVHNMQVRAQMPYVLQVVDAIAEPEFADEVRFQCLTTFGWNIPKRIDVSSKVSEHGNINAAVNWWAEAIQHPKMDNGDDGLASLMVMLGGRTSRRQLTEAELQTFREKLTEEITRQMARNGRLTLSVDYNPDRVLYQAGAAIGLGQFDYPCKTTMWITETEVSVRAGYGASEQTIWIANMDKAKLGNFAMGNGLPASK